MVVESQGATTRCCHPRPVGDVVSGRHVEPFSDVLPAEKDYLSLDKAKEVMLFDPMIFWPTYVIHVQSRTSHSIGLSRYPVQISCLGSRWKSQIAGLREKVFNPNRYKYVSQRYLPSISH